MVRNPTEADRFSLGIWTVGWTGTDPFGTDSRSSLDPWEYADKLAEPDARGITFHDNDVFPFNASGTGRNQRVKRLKDATDKAGLVIEMVTTNTFTHPVFRDGGLTSNDRAVRRFGLRKVLKNVDLVAEMGATTFVMWGGWEGAEYDSSEDLYAVHARYVEGLSTMAAYIKQQGYNLKIGLGPKPNEPRGDTFLLTIGHAFALITTLDNGDVVELNPEVGHEQMVNLNYTYNLALALHSGKLVYIDLNGQKGSKYDQDLVFSYGDLLSAFFTVDLLVDGFLACSDAPRYTGPIHFDYKPSRTEGMQGVWESAQVNMRSYLTLAEKAKAFRAGPEVQTLVKEASVYELGGPTLDKDENIEDFLARDEPFDVEAKIRREYHSAKLYQMAIEHLVS